MRFEIRLPTNEYELLTENGDVGMRHKFDIECGYTALNNASRNAMQRPVPTDAFTLLKSGVEKLSVLTGSECSEIRDFMDRGGDSLKLREAKIPVMERILTGGLDERMRAYFGSEYIPLWFRFYKAVPAENPNVSFRWHYDGGPSRHLKILLYLNGTEEHGGDTLFVDRETTDAFKEAGYVFCDINERLTDLDDIAAENGISFDPVSLAPNAGEAILFEPMNIMHRGCWPTKSPRYIIQICLLPSPAPWQDMCQLYDIPSEFNDWPIVADGWPARRL